MAEKKPVLTQKELEDYSRDLAAHLSACARQPVTIKILGIKGLPMLAFTHSVEDDKKKHIIPIVLNPGVLDGSVGDRPPIRNKRRALMIWKGMGAHELLHHLLPAGEFYVKAYAEGFGELMNLIDDEHIERNGRAMQPEWGECFQTMAPLAFPKKQALYGDGSKILAGGFGEENSESNRPAGRKANKIYTQRWNQFGYYLRRHNADPTTPMDAAVKDALKLIDDLGPKFKDLTKAELFEVVREVHETLCRGIDKPEQSRQFDTRPQNPDRQDGEEEDADEKAAREAQEGKQPSGPLQPIDPSKKPKGESPEGGLKEGDPKDGDPKEGDPKEGDPKDGDPKDGDPKDGDPKEGDPKDGDPKDGDPKEGDPKEGDPKEGDPKDGDPKDGDPKDGDSKDGKDKDGKGKKDDKTKKDEKNKDEKKKSSWDPRKMLKSKWLYVAFAILPVSWFTLFYTTTSMPFWLWLATLIGEMILFMLAIAFLFWGGMKAFVAYATLKKKGVIDDIRRFFMRKTVRYYLVYPGSALLAIVVGYLLLKHEGTAGTAWWIYFVGFFVVMRKTYKLSASKLGGVAPNPKTVNYLMLAALAVMGFSFYCLLNDLSTMHGWFSPLFRIAIWVLFTSPLPTSVLLLKYGTSGASAGGGGGFFGWMFGLPFAALRLIGKGIWQLIRHPAQSISKFFKFLWPWLKLIGPALKMLADAIAKRLLALGIVGTILVGIFAAIALFFLSVWRWSSWLVMGAVYLLWQAFANLFSGGGFIFRRIWWLLSLAFHWLLKRAAKVWFYAGPWLKYFWRHLWFRLTVFAALAAAIMMMIFAVLQWVAHTTNIFVMIILVILLLLLLALAFFKRKKIANWIMKELKLPLQQLMKQFMQAGLDMTTDWFVPIHNIKPVFADQAWLDHNMPEIIALGQQLRPLFAACGQGSIDKENQPDGFDLIDEIELALIGESSIFIDDETVQAASLDIQVMLDCSGSMGSPTRSLPPGGKFELGKLWAAAVEHAVTGLPGVSAHFWGFKGNVILDCGPPGQKRISGLQHGGGNNDSAMLWHAGQLSARSGKHMKILLMLSDGMPAECSWLSLKNLAIRFEQEGMIPWNIGLDTIEIRAFKFFTDLVGQSKEQAIKTMGNTLSVLVAERG